MRLSKVRADAAGKARQLLFGAVDGAPTFERSREDAGVFYCGYHVDESFAISMTFIGSSEEHGDQAVLVHVPGLPGAFPVSMEELRRHKQFFRLKTEGGSPASDESAQLALFCAAEAAGSGMDKMKVLDHLLSGSRRRLASLRGVETLLKIGHRINGEALHSSFPYHCGSDHAFKRYYDITPEACALFGPQMKHGAKMLCRYGVAVMVGVASDESLGCPAPFWNPSGAPAATLAPMFHGCHTLPVGEVKLEYNGPTANSVLLSPEDPARYLNPTLDGKYDVTAWLNEGLFGVKVGQKVERDSVVYGVCYNRERSEFELHVQELSTGEVRPSVCSFLTLP